MKRDTSGVWGDNITYCGNTSEDVMSRSVPYCNYPHDDSTQTMNFYFSTFWTLWPYACFNRPPRGTFASVQSVLSMQMPWTPSISVLSPDRCEWPLVLTPRMKEIKNEFYRLQREEGITDYTMVPGGRNLLVGYMNVPGTYEDGIVIPRSVAEAGLFSFRSICTYNLDRSTNAIEVNTELDTSTHP
jgi:hypothetical protein